MLAMHPIHISHDKASRSLTELEHFLADLSTINLDDLQQTFSPEPLRVSDSFDQWNRSFQRLNNQRCEKPSLTRRKKSPTEWPFHFLRPQGLPSLNGSTALKAVFASVENNWRASRWDFLSSGHNDRKWKDQVVGARRGFLFVINGTVRRSRYWQSSACWQN